METNHSQEWIRANRRFYALARQCNLSREDVAATIAGNYKNRISTRELTSQELHALCEALQQRAASDTFKEKDRWRKRLIASVRKYCEKMGYRTDTEYVISVIERDGTNINKLPLDRLRSLYNAFNKRVRDLNKTPDIPTKMTYDSPVCFINGEC